MMLQSRSRFVCRPIRLVICLTYSKVSVNVISRGMHQAAAGRVREIMVGA
jgi:hypothetical protein